MHAFHHFFDSTLYKGGIVLQPTEEHLWLQTTIWELTVYSPENNFVVFV